MANKTNGKGKTTEVKKAKKEKSKRIDFPIANALYTDADGKVVTAVNEDKVLIAIPIPIKDAEGKVIYAGFNTRKHNPLKKTDFANLQTHLRYQAFTSKIKAAVLLKKAAELETKAVHCEKFGDEVTRKKVKRMATMRKQLDILEKQLKEDGIDLEGV